MGIEQARTFLAIAAHGSFLEAAGRLHVTQSTVSARIQHLEAGLGARLLVRNRAGTSLTPAGRRCCARRPWQGSNQARSRPGYRHGSIKAPAAVR